MVDKKIFAGLGIMFVLLLTLAAILVFGKNDVERTNIALYYINPTDYILEKRVVSVEGKGDLTIAMTNLFQGIEEKSLENLFPKDAVFLSSTIDREDNVLIVDLSSNIISVNYGLEVNYLYIMSIVHTAADISGYDKIKLTFDGNEVEFFNDGLYIGDALKRDYSVVK